ncbi:MAG TPA: hypothetical protein PKE69_12865 [Pyrinomonadaceae bacterium]|nr:hypothetical protein [Pyrinomonadaceae bacterium]
MKAKTEKMLPKTMDGTVHAQFVRCGKKNCKCVKGELHGAYFYHFVRVSGKLIKRYLKPSEVEEMRTACATRQASGKSRIENRNDAWNALRLLREELRGIRNLYGN